MAIHCADALARALPPPPPPGGPPVDLILDSLLLFGRPSLGAIAGLLFGWTTQGEKHVRWVVYCVIGGYLLGALTMWPWWWAMVAAVVLLIPGAFGGLGGLVTAAGTLGTREDWYIRSWGFIGFLLVVQVCAIGAMAIVDGLD